MKQTCTSIVVAAPQICRDCWASPMVCFLGLCWVQFISYISGLNFHQGSTTGVGRERHQGKYEDNELQVDEEANVRNTRAACNMWNSNQFLHVRTAINCGTSLRHNFDP